MPRTRHLAAVLPLPLVKWHDVNQTGDTTQVRGRQARRGAGPVCNCNRFCKQHWRNRAMLVLPLPLAKHASPLFNLRWWCITFVRSKNFLPKFFCLPFLTKGVVSLKVGAKSFRWWPLQVQVLFCCCYLIFFLL